MVLKARLVGVSTLSGRHDCKGAGMRVWLSTFARAGQTHVIAQAAEAAGFYGLMLTDSQILVADPFVELAASAEVTSTLQLGTCATNLVTRHPTVLAATATTLQERSGGRVHLGVGRGDSAVTKVGMHGLPPSAFGQALRDLRRLVRGESVETDAVDVRLLWRDPNVAPVPVLGVASGPHVIDETARNADGLILQVGSDVDAVARGVEQARTAQRSDSFTIAAYVIVGLESPGASASEIDGVTPLLARMASDTLAADDSPQARAAAAAAHGYSLATHGLAEAGAGHPEIEDYAVRGDARECTERLQAIAATGCDELVVILGSVTTPTHELAGLVAAFGSQVLPALHADSLPS